jgi:hypothetical protein
MKKLLKRFALPGVLLALFCGMSSAYAAVQTYSYTITGTVLVGEETTDNAFDLFVGDTVTAYGTFTADLSVPGDVTVMFGSGSGNTMTIDLNGTFLTANDDVDFADNTGPFLTFNVMSLTDFDYLKTTSPAFNSSFLFFDDLGGAEGMLGQWDSSVSLVVVPVPAALWLFGSGLIGLAGIARRKVR